MPTRFFAALAATLLAPLLLIGCGDAAGLLFPEICRDECPDELLPVERCPAFTTCETFHGCDDRPLICAPEQDGDDENQSGPASPQDCSERPTCPPATEEVDHCPEDQLCTKISHCDTTLLCLEIPDACQQQPLCPDQDRHIEGDKCDDQLGSACYRHIHCSGPLLCLVCDELPDSCPEDQVPLSPEECQDLREPCRKVETCQETLLCGPAPEPEPPACELARECPGQSIARDDCEDDDPQCFTIETCEGPLQCGAPPDDGECLERSTCPDNYEEVSLALCSESPQECLFIAHCGLLLACSPLPS